MKTVAFGAIAVFWIVYAVVAAAPTTTPTPEICEGAQAWYDSIDSAEIASFVEAALDVKVSQVERIKARMEIYNLSDKLSDMKLPDCLKVAQKAYAKGLKGLTAALAMALPPYFADQQEVYPYKLAYSQRMIGEFRGYMAALGVELEHAVDPKYPTLPVDESYILTYK